MRREILASFALSMLFVLATSASAESPDAKPTPTEKKPDPIMPSAGVRGGALAMEEPRIQERAGRIKVELEAMDRSLLPDSDWAKEWAGTYYEGDGMGENVNIHLAPNGGIAYLNYGCLGLYGGDHGDIVEVLTDGLKVKLALGREQHSFLSERLYFVRWGERRYLVPEWAMMKLVNNYNEGSYARRAMYSIPRQYQDAKNLHRFEKETPPGRPELPAEYAKLLHDDPIELKVNSINTIKRLNPNNIVNGYESLIDFDGGSDNGVYLGQEFRYPAEVFEDQGVIKITRVDANSSTGKLTTFLSNKQEFKPPAVGEIVRTSGGDLVGAFKAKAEADAAKPSDNVTR